VTSLWGRELLKYSKLKIQYINLDLTYEVTKFLIFRRKREGSEVFPVLN
jgi:hypothetical protein